MAELRLTNIEKYNLQDMVLEDYINGDTIGSIVSKYSTEANPISWQNIAYFIQREEEDCTIRWQQLITKKSQNIFNKVEQMNQRLERMMKELEDIKNEPIVAAPGTTPDVIMMSRETRVIAMNREIRQTLELQQRQIKLITDIWDKINNQQKADKIRDEIISAIKEESPETALKIIKRLKMLQSERMVLIP